MSTDLTASFRLSFVTSKVDVPVPTIAEVLALVRLHPVWDVATIFPAGAQFPLIHIECRDGKGFVIQCFEDEESLSEFLVSNPHCSAPSIEVELGGQALERWPSELFVPASLAHQALDFFLESGKQDPALHWASIEAFPRETIWEGGEGKEAWERANRERRRDV